MVECLLEGGGPQVAVKVLVRDHPEHLQATRLARGIGRADRVEGGHARLIALAYSDGDIGPLEKPSAAFSLGSSVRREAMRRARELLLLKRERPSYRYCSGGPSASALIGCSGRGHGSDWLARVETGRRMCICPT